jgi:UDP-N-acetylmuramate dehydrogenase
MGEVIARAAAALGPRVQHGVALGPLTTYRVGGAAALFFQARDEADLAHVGAAVRASGVPVLVVGGGSNLLVADAGWQGLALALGEGFTGIEVSDPPGGGPTVVRAGAAVPLPVLARRTAALSLHGLEWAVGVPGNVGGAVRMNAGGHGSDVSRTLVAARVVDLGDSRGGRDLTPAALDFAYRRSSIGPHDVVVWAEFGLAPGNREASEAEIAAIVRWRRANQPGGSNGGSVFTNPPDDTAGRLIEAAGLKGHRVGSAHVSAKHANFFQADEGGSADDVRALIMEVQRLVHERMGVRLEPELCMVGFAPVPGSSRGGSSRGGSSRE